MDKNYKMLTDIFKKMTNDETLLRLLYYPPENIVENIPDPLDPSLPNIMEMDIQKRYGFIDKAIKKTSNTDDLSTPQCRILFYMGQRVANKSNPEYNKRQIIFDVVSHFDFEDVDFRSMRITDRLCELFVNKNVAGINKTEDAGGGQINGLPKGFVGYKNVFEFGSGAS